MGERYFREGRPLFMREETHCLALILKLISKREWNLNDVLEGFIMKRGNAFDY